MSIPLKLRPGQAIPSDLSIAIRMQRAPAVASTVAAVCVPCCRGYELVTGVGVSSTARFGEFTFDCDSESSPPNEPVDFSATFAANVDTCDRTDFSWSLDATNYAGTVTIDSQDTDGDGRPRVMISGTATCELLRNTLSLRLRLSDAELCLPLHIMSAQPVGCATTCPSGVDMLTGLGGAGSDPAGNGFNPSETTYLDAPVGVDWSIKPGSGATLCEGDGLDFDLSILTDPSGQLAATLTYAMSGDFVHIALNAELGSPGDLSGSTFQVQLISAGVGRSPICDPILFQCVS